MSSRRAAAAEEPDLSTQSSADGVSYVVIRMGGDLVKVHGEDIVQIEVKKFVPTRKIAGKVIVRKREYAKIGTVRGSHRAVVNYVIRSAGSPAIKSLAGKSVESRERRSFDQLPENAQARLLEDWDAAATQLREGLNLREKFEKSGRQYSELDADGNVVVRNARG